MKNIQCTKSLKWTFDTTTKWEVQVQKQYTVYLFELQLSSLPEVSADNLVQIYPMHATHGTVPEGQK